MDTAKDTDRNQFAEAKEAFRELELDQKATFLVTQAMNTAVEAVSTLVDVVAEECTELFSTPAAASEEEKDSSTDEPAS